MRVLLLALVTSLGVAACGLDTLGQLGDSPPDSGSPKDATRDVGEPSPDVVSPKDAGRPVDAMSPRDAREASSDGGSTSDAEGGEAGTIVNAMVTFYGWDDNTPPGTAIAYPKSSGYPTVHDAAGGTGTYADPITFATDMSEVPIGTFVYVPFIEKYVVMEDSCPMCNMQWSPSMTWHINVWMNSDGMEMPPALTMCEAAWMMAKTPIEIDPPPGRPVTTNPLFDPSTNTCRTSP
jgi:hypothetical protein